MSTEQQPTDIGVLLTLALAAFKNRLHEHLAKAGFADLGPAYGFVFRSLSERPHNLAELAARLEITPQGALKIVAEMIERGYVKRSDDDKDKRVRWLLLTERGEAALHEARQFHATAERELVNQLGPERIEATRMVLATLMGDATQSWGYGSRPF